MLQEGGKTAEDREPGLRAMGLDHRPEGYTKLPSSHEARGQRPEAGLISISSTNTESLSFSDSFILGMSLKGG